MDEDVFNIQVRKFLKKVGVHSQREIEKAVREGVESGRLGGSEKLKAEYGFIVGLANDMVGYIIPGYDFQVTPTRSMLPTRTSSSKSAGRSIGRHRRSRTSPPRRRSSRPRPRCGRSPGALAA